MRILVVEDELKVLNFVKKGFKEHGFAVDTAADGREAYFLAEGESYDCIVLDILLPKLNGYEVIERLRAKGIKTPVIFLSAKDAVEDRVRGLELGGDDYLTKPFAFSELMARVRALTRRKYDQEITRYTIDDLVIDVAKRTATRGGNRIELTPKEFTLLQFLAERQGEVVTRTMISAHVWGYDFDSMSNVIDVHMTNLRKKLEPPQSKPLIHTLRGVGYVLEARS